MEHPPNNRASLAGIALDTLTLGRCLQFLIIEQANVQQSSPPALDLASLTAGMVRSDESAYRRFFDLYYNRLLRYIIVLTGNEESAHEALQMTLLRIAKHVRRFDSEEAFWSWLTVLARSSVIDEGRKSRRYLALLTRFFEHQQIGASNANTADTRLLDLMRSNMEKLPDDERQLLHLKYSAGQSIRSLADQLSMTEKAVESRLSRARDRLKETILSQLKREK